MISNISNNLETNTDVTRVSASTPPRCRSESATYVNQKTAAASLAFGGSGGGAAHNNVLPLFIYCGSGERSFY